MPQYALNAEKYLRSKLQKQFGSVNEIFEDYDEQIKKLTVGYEHLYKNYQKKRIAICRYQNILYLSFQRHILTLHSLCAL